jgi:predicted dehydrogenase
VIGAGSMGKNHLRVVGEIPALELVGLFDANRETAHRVAQDYRTTAFESLPDLLQAVDAVSVAAPSSRHTEIAVEAARMRRHVLIEKPIALNTGDARRIIDACNAAGVTLMVGHIERFNPVFTELLKVLEDELILALSFRRLSPFDPRTGDANVVQDLMIHDIDLLCALAGSPVRQIASQGTNVHSGKPDHVQTLIRLENGIAADLTASRITESKVRRIEVTAKNAFIVANLLDRSLEIMRQTRFLPGMERSTTYRQENVVEKIYVPMSEPLRTEFTHFAECISTGAKPKTDGDSALKALLICEQITAGLQSGEEV